MKDKISQAESAIKALKRHTDKGTCPETLQYRARAKITADEEFKREIKQIRKKAEQETLNAIIRFHQREIGRSKAEIKKGKRAAPAIALNTKNCSTHLQIKGERFQRNVILDVRTHFKPTETFQYTHYSSCHPQGVKKRLHYRGSPPTSQNKLFQNIRRENYKFQSASAKERLPRGSH